MKRFLITMGLMSIVLELTLFQVMIYVYQGKCGCIAPKQDCTQYLMVSWRPAVEGAFLGCRCVSLKYFVLMLSRFALQIQGVKTLSETENLHVTHTKMPQSQRSLSPCSL